MVRMNTFLISVIVISCVPYLLSKEGVTYKFQRTLCNYFNPKFIYNTSCRVRHINRTAQLLNFEINIQPNVSISNIRMDVTTYYKYGTVYRPSLVKYTEFICDALKPNGTFSTIFNLMRTMYANKSNFLHPCPKSGKLYIKDMLLHSTDFPQFVPVGEARADTKLFTYMNGKEEFLVMAQDYVEVKALGIERF